MIGHPLQLTLLVLDVLTFGFVLYAGMHYFRVLLGWEPESTGSRQLSLESALAGAALAGRYARGFFITATLILVLGVSLVLPALVPGAMCGTGVLAAMEELGHLMLLRRLLALVGLWVWGTLNSIDASYPRPPAVRLEAWWLLLTLPLLGFAAYTTQRAILQIDLHRPVECCQAVYDSFQSPQEATTFVGLTDKGWLKISAGGAATIGALSVWGWFALRRRSTCLRLPIVVLIVLLLVWLPAAALTLVNVLAAYYYEVLHHNCPWCLFLPEHNCIGFPILGALVVIGLEAIALYAAGRLGRSEPALLEAARGRQRRALIALVLSLLIFVILAAGPPLWWRLQHGVWMG